jgi:hypothetical protein
MDNYFIELNNINVNDKTEQKNGLTYLSWAWAWGELKKKHPTATYTVYEDANGCFYHTDGKTCWVKTGVTVDGIEHIEYLPVMNFRNQSIPVDAVTSTDVNKAIQRSLTKAVARHGLGLYIYAGEDLPEEEKGESKKPEVISDKEKKTLEEMITKRGYTVAEIFPKGLDLTPEQYVKAIANLNSIQPKGTKK